jgi:hypothetical protein
LCINIYIKGQAYWCTPVIPALERLRQEDQEFESSLYFIERPSDQKKQTKKKEG